MTGRGTHGCCHGQRTGADVDDCPHRPYLYSLVKHNAAYSISLPLRALASTLLTLSVWEVAHVCFEVYATQVSPIPACSRARPTERVSQPMCVSHFAPKPNQCLRSGLASPDPYFQVSRSLTYLPID